MHDFKNQLRTSFHVWWSLYRLPDSSFLFRFGGQRGGNGKSWFSNFCVWFMFLDVSDRIKNQLRTLHKFCQRLQKASRVGNEWNFLCQAYYLWLCSIEPLKLSMVPHRISLFWGKSISTLLTYLVTVVRFKPRSIAPEVPCTQLFHYFRGLLLLPSVFNRQKTCTIVNKSDLR